MNKALNRHGKKPYSRIYDYKVTDPANMFYGWRKSHLSEGEWYDIQITDGCRFALDRQGEYRALA